MTPTPLLLHDALLVIDAQRDFLPGGALAVPRGDEIVPALNDYLARFVRRRLPVFATRDWHRANHCSFAVRGGPWPAHCVQGTRGADFASELNLPPTAVIVSKGADPEREAYSAFAGTGLAERLRATGIRRLFVGGLATDYCVLHTVRDALRAGFQVRLLRDAIRAVNLHPDDGRHAEEEMIRLGAIPVELADLASPRPDTSALLTDLYQLTMLRGYAAAGMRETAVFEFFVRRLPPGWNFLVAAGLEQALDFLEDFRFEPAELAWLENTAGFPPDFVRELASLRFTGDVHALPEGTIFFPQEPLLRVTAPIAQAQIVETRLINLLQFQTLIASKATRCVLAAPGKRLVDFGLRRAHGAEAGLLAARACHLAGFAATSDVLAGQRFGIPLSGTMAHSFIEACDSEEEAFLRFARANPDNVTLLLDTYDIAAAAATAVRLAPLLRAEGIAIRGVRLDSGDLASQAFQVRHILDAGGLRDTAIFASGNLDEHELRRLSESGAPIEGFGLGSRVLTSSDAPYLDCAYKLQAYAGRPRCKLSPGKATWPGAKQVFRVTDAGDAHDIVALDGEWHRGEPLLRHAMRSGRRLEAPPSLDSARERLARDLARLPMDIRSLESVAPHPVVFSEPLRALARNLGLRPETTAARPPGSSVFLRRLHADDSEPALAAAIEDETK